MFRIAPSRIESAGLGLFAARRIGADTVVKIEHGAPTSSASCGAVDGYELSFFVPEGVDGRTTCVFDARVCRLDDVWARLHPSSFRPSYVVSPVTDPVMVANDAAWPARTVRQYERRCLARNALEFVLSFDAAGVVNGVCAHFTRSVDEGDEVCVTYGWDFWRESY